MCILHMFMFHVLMIPQIQTCSRNGKLLAFQVNSFPVSLKICKAPNIQVCKKLEEEVLKKCSQAKSSIKQSERNISYTWFKQKQVGLMQKILITICRSRWHPFIKN